VSDVHQRGQNYCGGISNRIRSVLKTCPGRVFCLSVYQSYAQICLSHEGGNANVGQT